jgi:CelD/BcsL family acetyltransferase involved in cellulose biosynthesis
VRRIVARGANGGQLQPDALGPLIRRLAGGCRLLRLRHRDVTLAASICLIDDYRFHTWAGGCLYPDDLNWSPQYVLFHEELQHAWRSGARILEGGRRNDDFKRRYGLRPVGLVSCVEAA